MSKQEDIYKEAKLRQPNQQQKLLHLLREAGENGVMNYQLKGISLRYTALLNLLYNQGYAVDVKHISKGICKYTLIHEPSDKVSLLDDAENVLSHAALDNHGGLLDSEIFKKILNDYNLNIVRKNGTHKNMGVKN